MAGKRRSTRPYPASEESAAFGFRKIRVAAISMKPSKWKKEENANRLEEMFRQAAETDAELALAPEGVIEGYVRGESKAGVISVRVTHVDDHAYAYPKRNGGEFGKTFGKTRSAV